MGRPFQDEQRLGPTGAILRLHGERLGHVESTKRLRNVLDQVTDHSKTAIVAGSLCLIADLFRLVKAEPKKFSQLQS
jgi:hypothetical protein